MNHSQASILDHEEVARILKTDLKNGLTSFEARERLKRYGQNRLDSNDELIKSVPKLLIRLRQFMNPLIQLLIICVIVSIAIGEYENAISVTISILIICTVAFAQERVARKSAAKISKQAPSLCKVIRENQAHDLETQYLVPGDIIILQEGQKVPADCRLFDLQLLTVNEANLTGETQSQAKISEPLSAKLNLVLSNLIQLPSSASMTMKTANIDDHKEFVFQNLALMGTIVESGRSQGIVISTGKSTCYGEVFCMLKSTLQPRRPLQADIDQLSIHLVVISCTIIAILSILKIVQQQRAIEMADYAISLAVAAIPEGLPVVVALIMAYGVVKISKQRTIVKSLNCIETLGCIQVLCVDKTGTLTRDDMTLTDIVTSELHSISSGDLEELDNDECKNYMTFNKFGGKMYSIGRLMEVGTLCNNASFHSAPTEAAAVSAKKAAKSGKAHLTGDGGGGGGGGGAGGGKGGGGGGASHLIGQATECALLDAAIRMGFGDSRTKFDRLSEIPFDSITRRMSVLCQRRDLPGASPMYYVKGAWEDILKDCTHYYDCGLIKPKVDKMWLEYDRICTMLCSQGLRVLALATGPSLHELTFVGVVGINNTPREGIASTISKLRNDFKIDVKMMTGDSRATAIAVGKSLNLIPISSGDGGGMMLEEGEQEEQKLVMSGEQFEKILNSEMDNSARAHEISSRAIFYRVDPIQKATIVSKLQELGQIVAMTGDGANDVISLKRANLSLAMGSGANVCKEVADIIIVDNDLSVLNSAIVESKRIYHQIHRATLIHVANTFLLIFISLPWFARSYFFPFANDNNNINDTS